MNCKEYLHQITALHGPSGDEREIATALAQILNEYGTVTIDKMNNVICTIQGQGTHYLLEAHLDQIGMIVVGIDEDGFLQVAPVGGIDRRALLSHEVTVWGSEPLFGVVSCQPPHLLDKGSVQKSAVVTEIAIDIGLSQTQAQTKVSIGDRVTLKYRQNDLLANNYSASFLDDRSGVVAILMALETIKNQDNRPSITVIFSVQEEVGMRGAGVASYPVTADEALVVDVSFAMTPDSNKSQCGTLGKGAMIGIAPVLSRHIFTRLQEVAKTKHIPFQLEIMNETTGTNADVISITGKGVQTGLISIPQRYMHTPIETVNIEDVESVASLISAYLTRKGGSVHA